MFKLNLWSAFALSLISATLVQLSMLYFSKGTSFARYCAYKKLRNSNKTNCSRRTIALVLGVAELIVASLYKCLLLSTLLVARNAPVIDSLDKYIDAINAGKVQLTETTAYASNMEERE